MCKSGLSFWKIFSDPIGFVVDLLGFVLDKILIVFVDPISTWLTTALATFVQLDGARGGGGNYFINSIGTIFTKDKAIFTTLDKWFVTGGFTLATIFFIVRILKGLRDNLTGESEPNFAEIVGSYAVSLVLVIATPYIFSNFLLKLNVDMLNSFISISGTYKIQSGESLSKMVDFCGLKDPWQRVFTRIILFIAFAIFAYASAMRYVELILLYFLGPLFATSYTNRSNLYTTYWTESIAVIFTQSLHFFLLTLLLMLIRNMELGLNGAFFSKLILAVAIVMVALQGPKILRQYLQGAGLGGAGSVVRSKANQAMTMFRYARSTAKTNKAASGK
jgi:hypothetical protein